MPLLMGAALLAAPQSEAGKQPSATVDSGDRLFHERGCVHCHGATAAGTDKGPSLQKIGLKWKREQIERQIRDGGASMPAFGEALEPMEIDSLADYLVLKRGSPPVRKAGKGR